MGKIIFKWILGIVGAIVGLFVLAMIILMIFDHSPEAMSDYTEVTPSYSEDLLKKATDGSPRAQFYMGEYYRLGRGVNIDYEEAARWYRKSAEQGWIWSELQLADMYYHGDGVAQNYDEAMKWYRLFEEHEGGRTVERIIGLCYLKGHGVKQDAAQGAEWLEKAAKKNDIHAIYHLGECYYNGIGVEQDYKKAVKLLKDGAKGGHTGARALLAECYRLGRGVDVDMEKAQKWYEKAARYGNPKAIEGLKLLGK